jgi:hypothetical protein
MISFDEIKKYLPQYLSDKSQKNLYSDLKDFPSNVNGGHLYSNHLSKDNTIYQGDGIDGLMVVNLPDLEARPLKCIVLSNTCDIAPSNKRLFGSRLVYTPIFNLEKYRSALIHDHVKNGQLDTKIIDDHIETVKHQYITQIFYLPCCFGLENDSIVFLDNLFNCPTDELNDEFIRSHKLFTLSNYGFYMFLVKLSIHFTRIREGVDRNRDIQTEQV